MNTNTNTNTHTHTYMHIYCWWILTYKMKTKMTTICCWTCALLSYVHAYISRILYLMKTTRIQRRWPEYFVFKMMTTNRLRYICILRWRPVPHAYRVVSRRITYIQWWFKCVIFDMCSMNLGELCALVKIGEYLMMWDCACELVCSYFRWSLMMLSCLSVA